MKIKCIAIDDEPLALAQMKKYIGQIEFLDLQGAFRSARSALLWLEKNETDVIYVDINMPHLSGLDFVRSLSQKFLVVFATAYSEYALEGFRVNATDYLLKPFSFTEFLRSAEKAYHQLELQRSISTEHKEVIFVKSEHKIIPFTLNEIQYIESKSEYVCIFSDSQKSVMTLGSLKSYEEKLPVTIFMRIHRSYIINLNKISSIGCKRVILTSGAQIPVGELYEDSLRRYVNK